jgi:phosphoribosylformylglycinamidine cyclo-ligase
MTMPDELTYSGSGVSIDEGDRFVRLIRGIVRRTHTKRVIGGIGGFGGLFDARFKNLRRPVLVSSIDGVGTKLIVAQRAGVLTTVGQDLVNHCVNDILVCGARPLFFLDYYATGRLKPEAAADVVRGISLACRRNGCALIGGETAEMPGLYEEEDFDLAGAIVGVVDRSRIVDGTRIKKGDPLIGLPSTGLHTNGFSLARAVLFREYQLDTHVPELGSTVAEALLAVHRSYLRSVSRLLEKVEVRGMSHITGGGIVGNTTRILPKGRTLDIDWQAWRRPAIFGLIQRVGNVPEEDMRKTFNLGIGLVLVTGKRVADEALRRLRKMGEKPVVIGEVA